LLNRAAFKHEISSIESLFPMPKPLRVPDVVLRKASGPKITMLTAYDASIARLLADSGAVDILLVGDSLGMVQLGFETTVPVKMSDMIRHTRAVRAGAPDALIVADMPFLSHQLSEVQALLNAGKLIQQGGATAVKIEGGADVAGTVRRIVAAGIPVMGHVGLQPQSVHALGGFRRQARTAEEQDRLLSDALALEEAGVFAVVLEAVPDEAAATLTARLKVPVIGIGSGPACDGQVLVINDIVGLTTGTVPSFARRYANGGVAVRDAVRRFAEEVRARKFPLPRGTSPFEVIDNILDLRETIKRLRAAGASIGFVPTMGALHAGHAALLKRAKQENDCVVASIFVNPLQFDRKDDLERYPRTLETDLQTCRDEGASVVFTPRPHELYPSEQRTFVETSALSRYLCGEHRPGHFRGVETVVLKLLNIVQPDRAYFGEKDAQQLAIIRRMVRDLNVPVSIVPVATVREADGLALSSRNKNLTSHERAIAPVLASALRKAAEALDKGERSTEALREIALTELASHPEVRLEYLEFTDPETLVPLSRIENQALLAGAIWLGTTRLIDNVSWSVRSGQASNTASAEEAPALAASLESRKY
jgi:pantoate--beta-alanine ligase/3-methyl-2-oxobutanoate hydroxymethyltransferase